MFYVFSREFLDFDLLLIIRFVILFRKFFDLFFFGFNVMVYLVLFVLVNS